MLNRATLIHESTVAGVPAGSLPPDSHWDAHQERSEALHAVSGTSNLLQDHVREVVTGSAPSTFFTMPPKMQRRAQAIIDAATAQPVNGHSSSAVRCYLLL